MRPDGRSRVPWVGRAAHRIAPSPPQRIAAAKRQGRQRSVLPGSALDPGALRAESRDCDARRWTNVFEGLFGLLELGRIDAIIGYRAELDWFSDGKSPMVSYAIKNEDRYFNGHAACSKNEWGKKTVAKINKILLSIRKDQNFYDKYLVFIKDVDLNEYSLQVHKVFKK